MGLIVKLTQASKLDLVAVGAALTFIGAIVAGVF